MSLQPDMNNWTLVAAVNDEGVLRSSLLKSPDIDARCQVVLRSGYENAGRAYNAGLSEAANEIVVLAHQDVYLPPGWAARAQEGLARLDEKWAVAGVVGVAKSGSVAGHIYSAGLARTVGTPFDRPVECGSLDEMVLILRLSSGLRFDERLPGFHLYGTDVCLGAAEKGLKSYVIPAFCIHNSNRVVRLPAAFWRAYLYMRRKWRRQLPVRTLCTTITSGCGPMAWSVIRGVVTSNGRGGKRCADPERLCRELVAEWVEQ